MSVSKKILSIAIIGGPTSNTKALINACEDKGFPVKVYSIKNISLDSFSLKKDPFFNHDLYIFRGYNLSFTFAQSLAIILKDAGKTILDDSLTSRCIPSKAHEALLFESNYIAHPHTLYARSYSDWKSLIQSSQIQFPVIVKPENAQKGQGIIKVKTVKELLSFLKNNETGHIVQEFFPIMYDVRVFIVGDKILGSIKRNLAIGDFRTNASLGAKTEPYTLSKEESDIALQAHKALGYDISGVDLIEKNGITHVLEVNITPQWIAFQETLPEVNVAEEIIDFGIKKLNSK